MRTAQQYKARESVEERESMEQQYQIAEPVRNKHLALTIALILGVVAALIILASPEFGRRNATVLAFTFGVGALVAARISRS